MMSSYCCLCMQLEVPIELISASELEELRLQRRPSFTSLLSEVNVTKFHDQDTGIIQRRLSNGIAVNYKVHITFLFDQSALI